VGIGGEKGTRWTGLGEGGEAARVSLRELPRFILQGEKNRWP
jgi:hypothetical protein